MNSEFLKSLVTLAAQGSIAQTAQTQGLTATAVSQRLKALDQQFGTPLTLRSGKTVRLTEAGHRLVPYAKELLKAESNLANILNQDAIFGTLNLGVISTAMTGMVPNALKALKSSDQELEIKLRPGTSAQLYSQLLSDDLDAIIISNPPFLLPKEISFEILREEPLCLISAMPGLINQNEQELIANGTGLTNNLERRLSKEPFIRYDSASWGGKIVSQYMKDNKLNVSDFCELDALEAITVLVNSGLGWSLIPEWPSPWAEGLELAKVRISNPRYNRKIVLLRKSASLKETTIRYFAQIVKTHP